MKHLTLENFKSIFKGYVLPEELIELRDFQFGKPNDEIKYTFCMDFLLSDDGLDGYDSELLNSIIAFAYSDGAGGMFAFWLQDGSDNLSAAPIIHIDSEGGSSLFCKNIRDLLKILTADLDVGNYYEPDDDESDYIIEYRTWVKNTFNVDAIIPTDEDEYGTPSEIAELQKEAESIYGTKYKQWKSKYFHDY